jgi:lauroyl/myristoyl acyltransferase
VRHLGVRWALWVVVFVAAYFTLASPKSFRCSRDYLRRVLGPRAVWHWPLLVYRHFFAFGITLLDRLAAIMGDTRMQCRFDGEEQFVEALDRGRGVLLLGSHVGNWEMGAHLLGRLGRPVNLVVLERERDQIRRLFGAALERRQFRLLTTDEHPLRSVPILAALRRGENRGVAWGSQFRHPRPGLALSGRDRAVSRGPLSACRRQRRTTVPGVRPPGRHRPLRFFTYPAQY